MTAKDNALKAYDDWQKSHELEINAMLEKKMAIYAGKFKEFFGVAEDKAEILDGRFIFTSGEDKFVYDPDWRGVGGWAWMGVCPKCKEKTPGKFTNKLEVLGSSLVEFIPDAGHKCKEYPLPALPKWPKYGTFGEGRLRRFGEGNKTGELRWS